MTSRRLSIALVCAAVLVLPTSAMAAHKLVPPGNSGASQYFEAVPSASGSTPPPQPTSALPTSPGATALAKLGAPGRAAAALAVGGAPIPAGGVRPRRTSGTHRGGPRPRPAVHLGRPRPISSTHVSVPSGNSAVDSIAGAVTGSAGLGVVLPILLGGALAAAVAFTVARWMRRDAV